MINTKYAGTCLYRGKRKLDGEWVYGSLDISVDENFTISYYDIEDFYFVDIVKPETISAWTGAEDKNGVKIFCGDIVIDNEDERFQIEYCNYWFKWILRSSAECPISIHYWIYPEIILVIEGNIWDNPELLENENG